MFLKSQPTNQPTNQLHFGRWSTKDSCLLAPAGVRSETPRARDMTLLVSYANSAKKTRQKLKLSCTMMMKLPKSSNLTNLKAAKRFGVRFAPFSSIPGLAGGIHIPSPTAPIGPIHGRSQFKKNAMPPQEDSQTTGLFRNVKQTNQTNKPPTTTTTNNNNNNNHQKKNSTCGYLRFLSVPVP